MTPEPIRRSALRLRLGGLALCWRRRLLWHTGGLRFARPRPEVECPYLRAEHATPLLRRLRGYVEGMILRNGRVASGVGGGLCQMTNLLYWMTLHTPLTVTERWRHGYDVFPDSNRTQPFGSGATCFYNYMDLMVRNDTPDTWRLVLQVTDTHLEGEWRADGPQTCRYEVYEKEHEIRGEYWGGFTRHNTLFRRVLGMDGAELGEEFITENHAIMMYNPMLEETAP